MLTLRLEYHTRHKAPLILSHSWFLQVRASTSKLSWVEYHTLRFDYFKKTHMSKLFLQISHITFLYFKKTHMSKLFLQISHISTFLSIQISHAKYVVHQTQAIGTPYPPPQHHQIVQAIPISPSPPSPSSALRCVVFD